MIRLVYISTATETLGSGDVFKIIGKSAQNNAPAQLTGFLIFADGRFFQVIEGPHNGIDTLMRKLETDERHHSIEIVHRTAIKNRAFANWSMKRIAWPGGKGRIETLVPALSHAPEEVKDAAKDFLGLALT